MKRARHTRKKDGNAVDATRMQMESSWHNKKYPYIGIFHSTNASHVRIFYLCDPNKKEQTICSFFYRSASVFIQTLILSLVSEAVE